MCADILTVQGVLWFALQILPANNLRLFKTQQTTVNTRTPGTNEERKNAVELRSVHLPLPLMNSRNFLTI
jgi:anaerobic glycerol-3-phosphate dehydrogenase